MTKTESATATVQSPHSGPLEPIFPDRADRVPATTNVETAAGTQVPDLNGPPEWVTEFMDAASSGTNELRKEARKLLEGGYGEALQALLEDMASKAPEDAKEGLENMVKSVKAWAENPSQLEEGGRWWNYWSPSTFNSPFMSYYMPTMSNWNWLPMSGCKMQGGQSTKYTSTW